MFDFFCRDDERYYLICEAILCCDNGREGIIRERMKGFL